jgi:hypothetical protein
LKQDADGINPMQCNARNGGVPGRLADLTGGGSIGAMETAIGTGDGWMQDASAFVGFLFQVLFLGRTTRDRKI